MRPRPIDNWFKSILKKWEWSKIRQKMPAGVVK